MTFLKQACVEAGALKLPRRADHFELDRVLRASKDPSRESKSKEPWEAFIRRLDLDRSDQVKARDLRRLVSEIWGDTALKDAAEPVVEESVRRARKSIDLKIISAYLRAFPVDHPAFENLTNAGRLVAKRHDWLWRQRADKWRLFDPESGPERVSEALLDEQDPLYVFQDAGLHGDLATGGFVERAVIAACRRAALTSTENASEYGRRLIDLAGSFQGAGHLNAPLAYALLAPWRDASPTEAHKKLVTELLVQKIGDPRLQKSKWSALAADVEAIFPGAAISDAFDVLRRWLVQATFREFFSVVAKTVERRDQWRERTDFWMAYLDAGLILDAWFAFGSSAERMAKQLLEDKSVQYGRLEGTGATSQQSSLIFTLGDLRIGEWSDNGSCRFWSGRDRSAPKLYERRYAAYRLRTMTGGEDFRAIAHNPPNRWQPKFARHIYNMTDIEHPKHGRGW